MAWYWYWVIFLVIAGGSYYGIFYLLPVRRQRLQTQKNEPEAPPPEALIPDDDPIKNCPICNKEMTKDSLNGVTVDRCLMHGIWFDKGELKSVVDFVKSGGNVDGFFSGIGVDHK